MPLFDLKCHKCGKVTEYILGVCENDSPVKCSNKKCKELLTRDKNRTYSSNDTPTVVTQTGVGRTNW